MRTPKTDTIHIISIVAFTILAGSLIAIGFTFGLVGGLIAIATMSAWVLIGAAGAEEDKQ